MSRLIQLSVIICTWNRQVSLGETLSSLEKSQLPTGTTWEVLIVDNNSTDGTGTLCQRFVEQNPGRYRYLLEKRQGKSFALNTGVANAKGQILAFTDDDVTLHPEWLAETLRVFETHACAGVGGKIIAVWDSDKPDWLTSDGPYKLRPAIVSFDLGEKLCEMKFPAYGANLSLKKEVFEKHGMFRTDLGPTFGSEIRGEDNEFCWRLLRTGERLIYAPKAIVFHPVDKHRVNKRYFQEWYYGMGRSLPRIARPPQGAVRYFGFPRYMLGWYLRDFLLWISSLTPKRRFYYKLQFCATRGQIMEEKRIWQNSHQ